MLRSEHPTDSRSNSTANRTAMRNQLTFWQRYKFVQFAKLVLIKKIVSDREKIIVFYNLSKPLRNKQTEKITHIALENSWKCQRKKKNKRLVFIIIISLKSSNSLKLGNVIV